MVALLPAVSAPAIWMPPLVLKARSPAADSPLILPIVLSPPSSRSPVAEPSALAAVMTEPAAWVTEPLVACTLKAPLAVTRPVRRTCSLRRLTSPEAVIWSPNAPTSPLLNAMAMPPWACDVSVPVTPPVTPWLVIRPPEVSDRSPPTSMVSASMRLPTVLTVALPGRVRLSTPNWLAPPSVMSPPALALSLLP